MNMERKDLIEMLYLLYKQWPNMPIDEVMVKLWAVSFPGLDKERFYKAIIRCLKSAQYAPTIADIQKELDEMGRLEVLALQGPQKPYFPEYLAERCDPIPDDKMKVIRAQIANLCKKKVA